MKTKFFNSIVLVAFFFIFSHNAFAETFSLNPGDSIQAIIDSASDGDVLELSSGTYSEDINYSGKNITIRGEGRDTIISGTGTAPVVSFISDEPLTATLDNLTITGGNDEGGILIQNSRATISRCFVIFNRSEANGSGIYISGNDSEGNSAVLFNNIIAFNRLKKGSGGDPHGVFIRNADPSN